MQWAARVPSASSTGGYSCEAASAQLEPLEALSPLGVSPPHRDQTNGPGMINRRACPDELGWVDDEERGVGGEEGGGVGPGRGGPWEEEWGQRQAEAVQAASTCDTGGNRGKRRQCKRQMYIVLSYVPPSERLTSRTLHPRPPHPRCKVGHAPQPSYHPPCQWRCVGQ